MSNDFLFELGCEELPFAAVNTLAQALAASLSESLDKAGLKYQSIQHFSSPRRLALLIRQLQSKQASQKNLRRGPAKAASYDNNGQPTKALLGFAASCGVAVDELTLQETDKGAWLVHESIEEGNNTEDLMPQLINQAITALPIAKPMRWGDGDVEFARPVHWIVMLYGEKLVPCQILGVSSGLKTYGHRFHAPQAITLQTPDSYESSLEKAFVVADYTKRRNLIIEQVQATAAKLNATAIMPDELIDEVTAIVEWPQALLANFSPEFLEVPAEALIASMQSHQKCFALKNKEGKLLPHFIAVSNINSRSPETVIAGNEKVMRARLSDAAFFFQQDKKQALSQHIEATGKVVFQARLGTLLDKSHRLQTLMAYLTPLLKLDAQQAKRAAELSKCDLMTGMVGEFPELQGLMGYYYALHDGETEQVAHALNEQYLPRFAGDDLPATSLGLALSLADRLDTLVGIFAIGQKPSGVKDPFKLRRHALAVVRLLKATPAQLKLSELIQQAIKAYQGQIEASEAITELQPFILERLQSFYQGQGISVDRINAVRARQDNNLYDFDNRIQALSEFISRPEAASLSAACKRVNNILQQAKDQILDSTQVQESLLVDKAEKALFVDLVKMEESAQTLITQGNYSVILDQLAGLRESVDAFFDQVMVMVDNLPTRLNRLALLARLQLLLQGVADISQLQLNL